MDKLVISVEELVTVQKYVKKRHDRNQRQHEITQMPSKRLNGLVEKVVLMVAEAFVAFLINKSNYKIKTPPKLIKAEVENNFYIIY